MFKSAAFIALSIFLSSFALADRVTFTYYFDHPELKSIDGSYDFEPVGVDAPVEGSDCRVILDNDHVSYAELTLNYADGSYETVDTVTTVFKKKTGTIHKRIGRDTSYVLLFAMDLPSGSHLAMWNEFIRPGSVGCAHLQTNQDFFETRAHIGLFGSADENLFISRRASIGITN